MAGCEPNHLLGEKRVKTLPSAQSALTHMPRLFIALPDLFQN
jgi:hypothetical protein